MQLKSFCGVKVILVIWAMITLCSCSWEMGESLMDGGNPDGGSGTDSIKSFPPPPYGAEYGSTVENFSVEECICAGQQATGRKVRLSDYLGSKAVLITGHAGWCQFCEAQAKTMEEDVNRAYKDEGLEILLMLAEDADYSTNRQKLLDFCCEYKETHQMTFIVTVDPGESVVMNYTDAFPLNMLLDENMVIRFMSKGLITEVLDSNIQGLLQESTLVDNQAAGKFEFSLNNELVSEGKSDIQGAFDKKYLRVNYGGVAQYDPGTRKFNMESWGMLTNNLFQSIVIEFPQECLEENAFRFGVENPKACQNGNECEFPETCEDGFCKFGVYCGAIGTLDRIEVDDDGNEQSSTPLAQIAGGYVTFENVGTADGASVKGTMSLSFQKIEANP